MLYPLSYRGGGRQEAVRVTHEAPGDVDDRTGAARDREPGGAAGCCGRWTPCALAETDER